MTKLSFIVPVYNVEKYLLKCVDSLLTQNYSDYEIILVDDGSTDRSGAICDEYANSRLSTLDSPLIRVIHQENRGLSAARNAGLKVAKGEYVCFVDSDDYWEENVMGGLMKQIEREQLDVLRFDYQNVRVVDAEHIDVTRLEPKAIDAAHLDYEVFEPNKMPRYIDKCNEIVDGETYLNTRMGYACYAVMFILRRDLIYKSNIKHQTSNILFTEKIHFEDTDWLPRMMLRAKRVNSTTTIVYNYLVREGSITKTQGDRKKILKNLQDQMYIIERYKTYRETYPSCSWLKDMQSRMACGVLTTIARDCYSERKEYIRRLKELDVFPLSIADQGRTYKRRATIINAFGPYVYCWLMSYL